MKKSVTIVSAALAGLLGFGSVAFAAQGAWYTPSKTSVDLLRVIVLSEGENEIEDQKGDVLAKVAYEGPKFDKAMELAQQWSADGVSTADREKIYAAVESNTATAHEVVPLVLKDYDNEDLNFYVEFPTDYNYFLIKHVAVLITIADPNDTTKTVTYVVDGDVTDKGTVNFSLDQDVCTAINEGLAFIAIFSAE